MKKKKSHIDYTSRDFNTIKRDLVEHARRYYPDVYKDFNEASFGSLLMDSVAYVGDILSFYLDYQANESFLDTANERQNVVSLTKQMGYKYDETITSYGVCEFYISVPPDTAEGVGPALEFAPTLKKGSTINATNGGSYILIEDVDFSNSQNLVSIAEVNPNTGAPSRYAVRAEGQVKSGMIETTEVVVDRYERFKKIDILKKNVSEVISVEDSEGNRYYEVDHLSQDVIYKTVPNRNSDKTSVPSVIKPISVPRRYVLEFTPDKFHLQFGQGSEEEILSGSYVDPSRVVMKKFGREYISDPYLDPTNFTTTDKMGISPSNTILKIRYIADKIETTSAPVGSLNQMSNAEFSYADRNTLADSQLVTVESSIEVYNAEPILGDKTIPNIEEIRLHAKSLFAAQDRAVTKQDYKSMVYSMPGRFGAVKRCSVQVDRDSFKRNINLYVLAEGLQDNLQLATATLKNNLKTWISHYRMMSDTFDILDARVLNIAIDYEVVAEPNFDKEELNVICTRQIQEHFSLLPEIGESLHLNKIYNLLGKLEGVSDVIDVSVKTAMDTGYITIPYNIRDNLTLDGRTLAIPFDTIYELRSPRDNIRGTVI